MASIVLASYELSVPSSVVAITDPRVRVPCPGTPISTEYYSMSKQVNYSIFSISEHVCSTRSRRGLGRAELIVQTVLVT
jgi:hypothetical protein